MATRNQAILLHIVIIRTYSRWALPVHIRLLVWTVHTVVSLGSTPSPRYAEPGTSRMDLFLEIRVLLDVVVGGVPIAMLDSSLPTGLVPGYWAVSIVGVLCADGRVVGVDGRVV